jgi:phosphatidylethanolamine-binding protein (PEBP) family uncharacterized protein
MGWRRVRIAALGAGLIAISSSPAAAMSIEYSWKGYPACSISSPGFTLSEVPRGTVKLVFRMVDRDMPAYPHGGATIAYEGKDTIRPGAFSYTGPCPPPGKQHRYEWTVQAVDADGKVLDSASSRQKFPAP